MAWYNSSWTYRVKVTVQSSKIGSTLTNHPVFVDLSDLPAAFFSNVKSAGEDIRVTRSDETTECEIEVVAISTGSSTGELWFKANSLSSSTDTDFYIYYGNSGASAYADNATYGAENVWTAFAHVYHLNDNTDSAGNLDLTSGTTSYSTSVVPFGSSSADMNGSSDYLENTGVGAWTGGDSPVTITLWVRADNTSGGDYFGGIGDYVGQADQFFLSQGSATTINFLGISNDAVMTTSTMSNDTWHKITVTYAGSKALEIFTGKTSTDTDTLGVVQTLVASQVTIGRSHSGAANFAGYISEFRVADRVIGDDEIAAAYDNETDTSTFYSVGSPEEEVVAPVAAFSGTPLSGEKSVTVVFTDSSTNTPTSWLWDFGDDTTSTDQNPSHTYTAPGTFTVTLTATNAVGSDDEVKVDYVEVISVGSTITDGVASTVGMKGIRSEYPKTRGLVAGTTRQHGSSGSLSPSRSLVSKRDEAGL